MNRFLMKYASCNMLLMFWLSIGINAPLQAQDLFLPDTAFRAQLIQLGLDQNQDGKIQRAEVNELTELNLAFSPLVRDLTGLAAFRQLKVLRVNSHPIEVLPLDSLSQLEILEASNTQLESLFFPPQAQLKTLLLESNALTRIDLRPLEKVEAVFMGWSLLEEVELGNHPVLRDLHVASAWLKSLDLSGLPELRKLEVQNNQLATLNLRANPKLEALFCDNNELTELLLPNGYRLNLLLCRRNRLTELDIRNLSFLEHLDCAENRLTTLQMDRNFGLFSMTCDFNELRQMDFYACPQLRFITCTSNKFDKLDLSPLPQLEVIYLNDNYVEELRLPENGRLGELHLGSNPVIKELYVPESNNLYLLGIENCPNLGLVCFYDLKYALRQVNILDMGSPKVEYASCHGTAEVVMDETGLIFPNPATEKLFLKSRWSQSGNIRVSIPVHVSIFTEAGKQVLSRKLTAPPGVLTEIDVSYLPEALYFIRVAYDQSVGGYEPIWATILVRKE